MDREWWWPTTEIEQSRSAKWRQIGRIKTFIHEKTFPVLFFSTLWLLNVPLPCYSVVFLSDIPPLLRGRRELFHLQRELLRERTRSSVLEEQLRPINIHRWRRLEVKDRLRTACVCGTASGRPLAKCLSKVNLGVGRGKGRGANGL